ncbi:MAG: prepilin-type N-terminal cleavage/methylation domain-containing protein [Elusimicrobiaceae bacterium]|nr:prepilin-type N-terminal cleavage/methylation domain-containing protein [Elusimicrobiaceae bacterium]
MNKKAFTLMELMVVVLIIAILAAIALPLYHNAIDNQNNARAKAILEIINGGMVRFNREYPNVTIPRDADVYVSNPAANTACTYSGENNLSAANFIVQMVACGYIPRQNYGTATHVEGDGALDYRFVLQDPSSPVYGSGFVYMEPKPDANVGSRYCMANNNNCNYKAGIGRNGRAIDPYNQ